jgi:cyanate lyase
VLVYGHAIKALIHEKVPQISSISNLYASTKSQFGDGIMSMIDCKVNLEKKPDPKGDRVVLTFE